MAKMFGYHYYSLVKLSPPDLIKMKNAFKIKFQSYFLTKKRRLGVGIGVLNKYDCQPITIKFVTTQVFQFANHG